MLPKVQHALCSLAACCLTGLLFSTAWTGCTAGEAPPPDEAPAPVPAPAEGRFGDAYEVVVTASPDAPEVPPALAGGALLVQVGYGGGCEDHAFTLHHRTAQDTSRLWLRHDAHGDACEAYLRDDLRLSVPEEALRASTVLLLNPQGGMPFVLRWDRQSSEF